MYILAVNKNYIDELINIIRAQSDYVLTLHHKMLNNLTRKQRDKFTYKTDGDILNRIKKVTTNKKIHSYAVELMRAREVLDKLGQNLDDYYATYAQGA